MSYEDQTLDPFINDGDEEIPEIPEIPEVPETDKGDDDETEEFSDADL